MNNPRETIYGALFALASNLAWTDPAGEKRWQTKSRRMLGWEDVGSGAQPAFFQREARELADQQQGFGVGRWRLRAQWWIYLQIAPDPGTIPSQFINPLLDAIDALFVNPMGNQTLNGLVTNAWIDGEIVMDDPVSPDQQAVIVVPISLITGA